MDAREKEMKMPTVRKKVTRITRAPYRPNRTKFDGYIEWRQSNPHGTYADYRKAQEAN